jgi:hypothetical protein
MISARRWVSFGVVKGSGRGEVEGTVKRLCSSGIFYFQHGSYEAAAKRKSIRKIFPAAEFNVTSSTSARGWESAAEENRQYWWCVSCKKREWGRV